MHEKIMPVLLGADLNCYNIARAFHERYGVRSHAFGRYRIGVTSNTRILDFTVVPDLDDPESAKSMLLEFAKAHSDKIMIAFGCTDAYVELLAKLKPELSEYYIVPYTDYHLIKRLTDKSRFYELCRRMGIPFPATHVITPEDKPEIPFRPPVVIKPAVSAEYWKHEFEGMKKVYIAETVEEALGIISKIRAAGYPENIIVQDRIPGDDSHMYVLTAYCDRNAKVRMMCLGHVLLEEHTPKGLGNHAAIITESNPQLCDRLRSLLEEVGFTGYANFDIKYDSRDDTFRVFEINVRLGRSNYYVTAAGNNVAEYIVRDYLEGGFTDADGCKISEREIYWRYIPDCIVYKYSTPELASRVRMLKKCGRAYSSLRYGPDLKGNIKRRVYVWLHEKRHIGKFKKYYKIPEKN